jgi:hypothetical protein
MKAKEFDEDTQSLLFYPELINEGRWLDLKPKQAQEYLEKYKDEWAYVEKVVTEKHCFLKKRKRISSRLRNKIAKNPERYLRERTKKRRFISIKQNIRSGHVETINICDSRGSQTFHQIVKIYRGKRYGEWDRIPAPESLHLVEAWHWMPLKKSTTLHESIIHAAGGVSRCDYYYQDGRQAFFDIQFDRMRTFVEHFTEIKIEDFDTFLRRCYKSGPGFIRDLADFVAGKEAIVRDEPNIGNLIDGFYKIVSGKHITTGELAAAQRAASDKETMNEFLSIFQ